jgi:hypothetical protein|eukprot:evm.model.NODE_41154_length_22195_cov_27.575174.2
MEQQLQSAPRIDAADIRQYQGQVVRIVGKVEQGNHPVAVLGCGPDGSVRVQVKMAPGNQYNSAYVEVMGRVNHDGMEEIMSYDLGDAFDMDNYQQLLTFSTGQFRPLFA